MKTVATIGIILVIIFIILKITKKPAVQSFVCPTTEWVNCMPTVPKDRQYQCQSEYLKWATANCPGFKGAAY